MPHRKTLWLFVLFVLILFAVAPVLAQRPAVTVTPTWRPGEQLSTLDINGNGVMDLPDDDFRYVDVQLLMTGNVQFWAVNLACQFTPTVLETYVHDAGSSNGDPGDDIPVVTWGPDWGATTEFVAVDSGSGLGYDYDPGTGRITIRATRLGNVPPLGMNGIDYNLLLATIRLRMADLGTTLVNTTASVSCRPLDFFDRDGNRIVSGRMGRVNRLTVRSGYSLSGQALLQAARSHSGINVSCDNGSGPIVATTDSRGNYSFGSSGDPIREFDTYECQFVSPIIGPNRAEFLDASTQVMLNFPTQSLLPVILKGGNVDITAGSANDIDSDDLFQFTTNWAPGSVANAYDGLDVNGNSRVDEPDLAIFAGNYDDPGAGDLSFVDASHLLFGLATDYGGTFPNSRVYWGDTQAGPVQRLFDPRRERAFWPSMAPDGENFAYIQTVPRSGQYMLYTSPVSRVRGSAMLNSRTFTDDALAPSWSPDGQRLAFICSKGDNYQYNEGDLCVINADGSNLRQVATKSKIYPPAWFDNNVVLYAGLDDHPTTSCQDNLCFVDLANNLSGQVSGSILSDSDDVADMPAMSSYGVQLVLMLRLWNGTDNSIEAYNITYNGAGTFTLTNNETVINPATYNVDYYDVSPFMDVIYTEYTISNGAFRTLDTFHNLLFNLDGSPALSDGWSDGGSHTVDGFVGNPTTMTEFSGGGAWNGDLTFGTLFHAERATVEWLP